jgi:hypothetical protein
MLSTARRCVSLLTRNRRLKHAALPVGDVHASSFGGPTEGHASRETPALKQAHI